MKNRFKQLLVAVVFILDVAQMGSSSFNSPLNLPSHNSPSSKGNEFVLAFWSNGGEANFPMPTIALFVTTDDPDPVSFTVDAPNTNIFSEMTYTANAGQTTTITLPTNDASPTVQTQDIRVFHTTERNKGIHVKAEDGKKITVYGLNDDDASTDAFLALPCVDYGEFAPDRYSYYVFSADIEGTTETFSSRFMIIPCEDDTEVNLIPSHILAIDADISSTGFPAQVGPSIGIRNFRIPLDRLQTAMFQSPDDLTGTILESNKPITVIVGHECGQVPTGFATCDVLVEQVPPHITYGTRFLTAPLQFRESGERYRIGSVSNSPNEVTVTCTSEDGTPETRLTQTLTRGQYAEFDTSGNSEPGPTESYRREFCCIKSSLPATVMQYLKGHSADEVFDKGDPSMLYIPPVTQYLNDFTLTTAKQVRTSFQGYISYTIPSEFFTDPLVDGRKLLVNGMTFNPDSGYLPIYCPDKSTFAVCGYGAYSALPQGDHKIIYNQTGAGFFPFIYGLDREISFGYPLGFELEAESLPVIEIPDQTVLENIGSIEFPIRRVGGDLGLPSFIVVSSRDTRTGIGCATAGSDYEAIQPTNNNFAGHRLRYQPDNELPRSADTLRITIIDDDDQESMETFEVYLVEVRRNSFVSKPIGTVTIVDDDSGEDYKVVSNTTFNFNGKSSTSTPLCVEIMTFSDEDTDENDETFYVTLLLSDAQLDRVVTIEPNSAQVVIRNKNRTQNAPRILRDLLVNKPNHLLKYNIGNNFCLENATAELNFTIYCNPIDSLEATNSTWWIFDRDNMEEVEIVNKTDILCIEYSEDFNSSLLFGPATLLDLAQYSNTSGENISIVIGCRLTNEFGSDNETIEITQCAPDACQDGGTNNCNQKCSRDERGIHKCSCADGYLLDTDNETCIATRCSDLDDPDNGMVEFSRTFQSVANYSCEPTMYILIPHDQNQRTCLSNGSWNGTAPTCRKCEGGAADDGTFCEDICNSSNHNCTTSATCVSTGPGNDTFICTCSFFYQLQSDGVSCKVHTAVIAVSVTVGIILLFIVIVLAAAGIRKYNNKLKQIALKEQALLDAKDSANLYGSKLHLYALSY